MLRILLLVLVGVAVVLWWKHRQRGSRTPATPAPASPETMLRCAHCGVHLPSSQALPGRGGVFCCTEHRAQFEAGR